MLWILQENDRVYNSGSLPPEDDEAETLNSQVGYFINIWKCSCWCAHVMMKQMDCISRCWNL